MKISNTTLYTTLFLSLLSYPLNALAAGGAGNNGSGMGSSVTNSSGGTSQASGISRGASYPRSPNGPAGASPSSGAYGTPVRNNYSGNSSTGQGYGNNTRTGPGTGSWGANTHR